MKGVILAGGNGTRLFPLTKITNKHLLPLYNKPVIFHAVEKLVNAGIDRIMIVLSPQYLDDFVSVLGSGQDFKSQNGDHQIQIVYGIQNEPCGIAQGLWIARDFVAKAIQALEVQKMSLSALKSMNFNLGGAISGAEPGKAKTGKATAAAAGQVDPMQWWGALSQQFQTIAAGAMKDMAQQAGSAPGTAPAQAKAKPVRAKARPRAS